MNTTTQSQPPAAGEAAHTLPVLKITNGGDIYVNTSGFNKVILTNTAYNSEDQRAIIERAVRACNSHAALVEAMTEILEELNDRYDGAPDSTTRWMASHIDRITKALT